MAAASGATLTPRYYEQAGEKSFSFCFECGDTDRSNAVLNTLLFIPLGLIAGRRGVLTSIAIGASVSLGIEVTQLWIPGRFSNLADIVWNSLGAGIGASLGLICTLRAPRASNT